MNYIISNKEEKEGQIVLYQPDDSICLEVKLDKETVWLSQQQMADLFDTNRTSILRHISNIYKSDELQEISTCAKIAQVRQEGNRQVTREISFYNLDVIISVGYRVNSKRGTQFRIWANKVLKDYLLKGYSINRQLIALQERTDERFLEVQHQLDEQKQQVDFLVNIHQQPKEELFATGCMWDAYSFLSNLIRLAKIKVELVDNYCNGKTLSLLDERAEGVKAIVHTTYNKTFEDALIAHNNQKEPVEFIQLPHKVHDRFLIIDAQVYLLGNSLKDMGHTLSAAILTGFTPEEILEKLV